MASWEKIWFITGCSSGFGFSITKYALSKGDKVVATLRRPEVLSELAAKYPETLLVLKLDVTQPAEITAAFNAAQEKFGRIDVVVNNAGFGIISEVEGTTDSNARSVFEVNFWGASHVSREAVRFFREENKPIGGRLLQVSSLSGIHSAPGAVYYSASKFGGSLHAHGRWLPEKLRKLLVALEALSEGLAKELSPDWNIKVTILEPGPFRTSIIDKPITDPIHPAYSDPLLPSIKWRDICATNAESWFDGDADKFAEAVYKAAYLEDPPLRLPVHPLSLVILREKANHFLETADKWESWSDGVLLKE